MCSYNDLYNIRNNIEPRGFRLNLDKYKSNNVKNIKYISVQNIGEKASQLRAALLINQVKNNENIYSSLLEIDDIKSANNFSKLVDCDLSKTNPELFYYIRKKYYESDNNKDKSILNFNVYPKKDKTGRMNPINTTYSFNFGDPLESFAGIYELTTTPLYTEDTVISEDDMDHPGDTGFEWDIHYNEFLFNKLWKKCFLNQRTSYLDSYKDLKKAYKEKKKIGQGYIMSMQRQLLKASLMLPSALSSIKLDKLYNGNLGHLFNRKRFDYFTRFNRDIYRFMTQRNEYTITLDDIIRIIVSDLTTEEEIIILDFGCKNISDLDYDSQHWKKPIMSQTSTIQLSYPLEREIGPLLIPTKSQYKYNRLLAEIGK